MALGNVGVSAAASRSPSPPSKSEAEPTKGPAAASPKAWIMGRDTAFPPAFDGPRPQRRPARRVGSRSRRHHVPESLPRHRRDRLEDLGVRGRPARQSLFRGAPVVRQESLVTVGTPAAFGRRERRLVGREVGASPGSRRLAQAPVKPPLSPACSLCRRSSFQPPGTHPPAPLARSARPLVGPWPTFSPQQASGIRQSRTPSGAWISYPDP